MHSSSQSTGKDAESRGFLFQPTGSTVGSEQPGLRTLGKQMMVGRWPSGEWRQVQPDSCKSRRAVIVPATCYFAFKTLNEMKYNRCEDLHQDAGRQGSQRGPTLSLATERQLVTCQPHEVMVWETPHGNFLTCQLLPLVNPSPFMIPVETFTALS